MATFGIIICSILSYVSVADPTIVDTEYGPIQGLIIGDGTRVFRSIPYAKPPLGDLRWTDPQPPDSWTSTLDCTEEVIGCPQS